MSLAWFRGSLWAMKTIAVQAEREFAAERLKRKPTATILKPDFKREISRGLFMKKNGTR